MGQSLAELSYSDAPKIVVKPPGPKATEIMEKLLKYVPQHLYDLPSFPFTVWDSQRGATMRDVDGNIFIDFTGGMHTASTGYCHPKVVQAIAEITAKLAQASSGQTAIRVEAARKLLKIIPSGMRNKCKTFFQSSGTEAVEAMTRIARFFTKKTNIISLHHHYYGRGQIAATMTGPALACLFKGFGPYPSGALHAPTPYCYRCSFGQIYPGCDLLCADYLQEVIKTESAPDDVAGLILEPWARWGGTPKGYLTRVKEICEENEMLLLCDEITCGFGRTGKWWACEWENVTPDIMTTAKGLTSGYGGSAVVAPNEMLEILPPGSQIQTYAMQPLTCASVSATIDVMKEMNIVQNAARVGDHILKRLTEMKEEHELIGNVWGRGLHFGVDLVKNRKTKEPAREEGHQILVKAFEKGLNNFGVGWSTPPLILTRELAEKALDILEESIKEVETGL